MPGSQTRKNKPKGHNILAKLRQNLARQQQYRRFRTAKKVTARNVEKSKKILAAATRAIQKAARNATMRSGPRTRAAANSVFTTRKSARIATRNANAAIKAQERAARKAAAKAAKIDKKIEKYLRELNAENAKAKAKQVKRELARAELEAVVAEESAERKANAAQKQLEAAASRRMSGSPTRALTSAERTALNSLSKQLGKMHVK